MKTINILVIVIMISSLLISSCVSSSKPSGPVTDEIIDETLITEVQPWEDGLRTDPDGNSFEWWYFDAAFTDGSTAVIVFFTKDMLSPEEKANPFVSIVITDPKGNTIEAIDSLDSGEFTASKANLDVKINNSSVKGDITQCLIHFEKDGIEADLTFISKAPARRPPNEGKLDFDSKAGKYFAWLPAMPYAEVGGSLNYNGITTKVTGTGYHDHNWGNLRLDKVMTQWYWGRARIDDYTLIFSQMPTAPKYGSIKVPVFYLAKGNELISTSEFEFNLTPSNWTRHSGGRDYPGEIVIDIVQKEFHSKFHITNPSLIEAKDFLEDFPWAVRWTVGLFTNPYYFRFDADFYMEISDSTGRTVEAGNGIFEVMLLKGKQTIR